MPWRGVTVSEQRQRFLEDYKLNYYSVTELAERFGISRKTAHKWITRYKELGQSGFHERSRRPHSCPWQTDAAIVEEVVKLRKAHPHWGPRKLLDLMVRRNPRWELPSVSTGAGSWPEKGCQTPAVLSAGASRVPEDHPPGSQRHLGRGLQGAVPLEERQLLLPADRE